MREGLTINKELCNECNILELKIEFAIRKYEELSFQKYCKNVDNEQIIEYLKIEVIRLQCKIENVADEEDYERIENKINDDYNLDQDMKLKEHASMNEKVKDSSPVKKRYNEEHISLSESKNDSEVIIKSYLESDFDIEYDKYPDLLCRIFNDYG